MDHLELDSLEDWRDWLKKNDHTSNEIWIILRKGVQGRSSLTMRDAVGEAICYGWIDSRTKRLDEKRYLIRFTPRKNNTNWSARNLKRAKELVDQGRMTKFGMSKLPSDFLELSVPERMTEEWETGPSPDLEAALKADAALWNLYLDLPPGRRKEFNRWVFNAKRPETIVKRIRRTVELVSSGRSLTEDMMSRMVKK